MQHTPEPWTITTDDPLILIRGSDGHPVMSRARPPGRRRPDGEREANVRRIVACVNFCARYDTQLLEIGPSLTEIIGQGSVNAALLAACRTSLLLLEMRLALASDRERAHIDTLRRVIAHAEGE